MDQPSSQADNFSIRIDADGASRIEGAGWNLRTCAPTSPPDSIALLVAALGACAAQVCAPIVARAGLGAEALQLKLSLSRDGAHGLASIALDLKLADGDARLAEKLARAIRGCPVRRCLDPAIAFEVRTFEPTA